MINPTVGRVMWFNAGDGEPQCAHVVAVHGNDVVNLVTFDKQGNPTKRHNVKVHQGEFKDCPGGQAGWMPYQQGQAKKDSPEQVEKLKWLDTHEERLRKLEARLVAPEGQATPAPVQDTPKEAASNPKK